MKQLITVEQLDELSSEGKKNLRRWWHTLTAGDSFIQDQDKFYPLLSIGQMIEFLEENNGNTWGALIYGYDDFFKPVNEWCDALWQKVKEILENGKSSK